MTEHTPWANRAQLVSERMRYLIGVANLAFTNIDTVLDPLDEMCDEVARIETTNAELLEALKFMLIDHGTVARTQARNAIQHAEESKRCKN